MRRAGIVRVAALALAVGVGVGSTGCEPSPELELERGRRYACATGEECRGGWVCRQDGFCHDPAVGEPLTCAASEDCTGGWHCGAEGVCYDRDLAQAVACRTELGMEDGEGDCAPGWRCGFEERCHAVGAAAPYECRGDDTRCEAGWRCGVDERCVDVAEEALRPGPDLVSLAYAAVSPLKTAPADLFLAAPQERFGTRSHGVRVRTPEGFHAANGFPGGGGSSSGSFAYFVAGMSTGALLGHGTATWHQSGGALVFGGGSQAAPAVLDTLPANLRQLLVAPYENRFVVALTDAEYRFIREERTSPVLTGPLFPGILSGQVHEAVIAGNRTSFNYHAVVVATSEGVLVALESSNHHFDQFSSMSGLEYEQPVFARPLLAGISAPGCSTGGAEPVGVRARFNPDNGGAGTTLALAVLTGAAGAERISLYEYGNWFAAHPGGPACSNPWPVQYADCDPCPGAQTLVDYQLLPTFSETTVEALCVEPAAGGGVHHRYMALTRSSAGACDVAPLARCDQGECVSPELPVAPVGGNYPALLAEDGRLFVCGQLAFAESFGDCHSFQQAGPTLQAFSLPDGVIRTRGLATTVEGPLTRTFESGPLGLLPTSSGNPQVHASVGGAEGDLVITSQGGLGSPGGPGIATAGGGFVKITLAPNDHVGSGVLAHRASASDGVDRYFVTLEEKLYAGGADPEGPLEPRLIPLPGAAITSLVMLDLDPSHAEDGVFAAGYVVAGQRLFHVGADIPTRWRATEVLLGKEVPVEVWADVARARVGLGDGRVFSLPGRVPVAPAVPGGVLHFAAHCGTAAALGTDGVLYLLTVAPGSSVGVWSPVTQAAQAGVTWTGMYALSPGRLLLSDDHGRVASLTAPSCGP